MTKSKQAVFDTGTAADVLRKACSLAKVDLGEAELLRLGDHAVFRIQGGRIVVRVGRGPERLASVRREVTVAHWLESAQYPSARLVAAADQPVVVDGHPVTFWEGLANGDSYATTHEMGVLLRRLHDLEAPPFPLPPLRPFDKVTERLEGAAITDEFRVYLTSLAEKLAREYASMQFELPPGPLHGDFNVGNVLHDSSGSPKVIDLDGFVAGPREWDLVQTAMYFDSFGWHSKAEYDDFVTGYGFDVRKWSGYSSLRGIRELLMVTWLSQNVGTSEQAASEMAKRVKALRTGGSRRDWAPF